jgi:N-acetylglucosaminyldiphosphoundecaprenol N-acetyl-beta-D-mannosaminyltransferase
VLPDTSSNINPTGGRLSHKRATSPGRGADFAAGFPPTGADLPSFKIFGLRVHAIEMADTLERLRCWIDDRQASARFVAVTAMHGVAEARRNGAFRNILNSADLVVADGTPLVWIGRIKGHHLRRRVSGCDLLDNFCRESGSAYRHFFYGGTQGAAESLARTLRDKFGIVIAGTYTPPFRPLTNAEEEELTAMVEQASPDVLWVGLSSPKQETFMYEHRDRLKVPLMLGVGAAFDLNSGNVRRAPVWMRDYGLEWLFRLAAEPRRLWRRYLITIPKAVWFVCLELIGFSKVPVGESRNPRNEQITFDRWIPIEKTNTAGEVDEYVG